MIYYLLGIAAGIVGPIQVLMNTTLAKSLESTLWATLMAFGIGFVALLSFLVLSRSPIPTMTMVTSAPWWAWLGAFGGFVYISGTIVAAPHIGSAALMGLVVLGMMVAGMIMDHFGIGGMHLHPISYYRIIGVILLLVGVYLINKF